MVPSVQESRGSLYSLKATLEDNTCSDPTLCKLPVSKKTLVSECRCSPPSQVMVISVPTSDGEREREPLEEGVPAQGCTLPQPGFLRLPTQLCTFQVLDELGQHMLLRRDCKPVSTKFTGVTHTPRGDGRAGGGGPGTPAHFSLAFPLLPPSPDDKNWTLSAALPLLNQDAMPQVGNLPSPPPLTP